MYFIILNWTEPLFQLDWHASVEYITKSEGWGMVALLWMLRLPIVSCTNMTLFRYRTWQKFKRGMNRRSLAALLIGTTNVGTWLLVSIQFRPEKINAELNESLLIYSGAEILNFESHILSNAFLVSFPKRITCRNYGDGCRWF